MDSDFYLMWPDKEELRKAGYGAVAHAPFVFNSDWWYQEIESGYLRDRARGKVNSKSERPTIKPGRRPTVKSMETFGAALINFLEWSATGKKRDWREFDYFDDILEGYQADMETGRWSVQGRPLASRTINLRVGEACNFLDWAARNGHRKPFEVATRDVLAPPSQSHKFQAGRSYRTVKVRLGSARVDPVLLHIPSDTEVDLWLKSVRISRGLTKWLMCLLITRTAIRREEAVQWQIDTLPLDRRDWLRTGDHVTVSIGSGTKGAKRRNARGQEIGPIRHIVMPMEVALALELYRNTLRPGLRARYVKAATSVAERRARMQETTTCLFLSDTTGRPVSAQRLYAAWTDSPCLPYKGWSPNCGRHYWACKSLLKHANVHESTAELVAAYGDDHHPVISAALDHINLYIRPQLGHVDENTTQGYLVWLRRTMLLTNVALDYGHRLDDLDWEGPEHG